MNPSLRLLPLLALVLLPGQLLADAREWKSSDGNSSFQGEYMSHDTQSVTIRRTDGRVFKLDLSRLHEQDRLWVADRKTEADEEPAAEPGVFDTLRFGDTRQQVEDKLKASKMVETHVDETFLGRVGLNGTFRTRERIGGLQCDLYFDWTPEGRLQEITLQSPGLDRSAYDEQLRANWKEFASMLANLHGKPLQTAGYPKVTDLQNDLFLASHLWRLGGGGSVLLGTSMQADKYLVVVRFTAEKIEPVRTP